MAAKAMSKSHAERLKRYEEARNRDIVSVAESLGMNLSGRGNDLYWDQHDSLKINRKKNYFYWNSRQKGGGPIELVQMIKECKPKEAVNFLFDPEYQIGEAAEHKEEHKEFNYFFSDHKNLALTKDYLVNQRKLSEEIVDHYISEGLIAQTTYKDPYDRKTEPVMVFKSRDNENKVTSVSLRGLWKQDKYDGNGYLRRHLGDGFTGMVIKVGNPPEGSEISKERPLKIIAIEAPIDALSYFEIYQHEIGDSLLLTMDGLKKRTISKLIANQLKLSISEDEKINYMDILSKHMKENDLIQLVLAVDNDSSGKKFLEEFKDVPFSVISQLPALSAGETKSDWNEVMKRQKIHDEKNEFMLAPPVKENKMETDEKLKVHELEAKMGVTVKKTDAVERIKISSLEQKNLKAVEDIGVQLENTFDQTSKEKGPANHYLTREEVQGMLDEHLSKIEQILYSQTSKVEKIENPTRREIEEVAEELSKDLEKQSISFNTKLKVALGTKKNEIVYNVKEHVDNLRLAIKNGFNKRILLINKKIKNFSEKVDYLFAIEEKVIKKHLNEKYKNTSKQDVVYRPIGSMKMEYGTLLANLVNLADEQKAYLRKTIELTENSNKLEKLNVLLNQRKENQYEGADQPTRTQENEEKSIERKFEKLNKNHMSLESDLSSIEQLLITEDKKVCDELLQYEPTFKALGQFYKNFYEISKDEVIVSMNQNDCDRDTAISILADRYFKRNEFGIIHNLLADLPIFESNLKTVMEIIHNEKTIETFIDATAIISKLKVNGLNIAVNDLQETNLVPKRQVKKTTGSPKNIFEERIAKAKKEEKIKANEDSITINKPSESNQNMIKKAR